MDLRTLQYFVAVAEERHFGRAATRLHITQPPLSRAIKRLEADLGCLLLDRSPSGVDLTPAGAALYDEARTLLAQADQARTRVIAVSGTDTITVGTLGDTVSEAGASAAAAFRERHPGIRVRIRESDFTDPTTGLRSGLVDVAMTRGPFDTTGIMTRVLRTDPIGVVLRDDDPLAGSLTLSLTELTDRRWFRFPDGTDAVWRAYWNRGDGPVVRTVHECVHSVLWDNTVGLAPLGHELPKGLTTIPLRDMPPSPLLVAWPATNPNPLVRSFVELATG